MRTEAREQVELPVSLRDIGAARTRDVSATGLYLETDGTLVKGSVIDFSIELSIDNRSMLLTGQGEVVRVEVREGRTGVGIRMLDSRLEINTSVGF